ncbi:hypothetical protein ACSBR1_022739 [Camellia fascicularis]
MDKNKRQGFRIHRSPTYWTGKRNGILKVDYYVKQGPSAGKAAIGGSFNLIDHNGNAVTDRDFLGNWTVVYFGFTHCPHRCPDELQKLADAVDKIKEKAGIEIVPVFISVDPERDTVEQVREYVKAARAFRVYYMKTEEEGSDYLVDQSIIMLKNVVYYPNYALVSGVMLQKTSCAVHQLLIQSGLRMSASIVAETAQCFSTHQFACLIGYGAR